MKQNLSTTSAITIRAELPGDRAAVRRVSEAAFETPLEANLIDVLREKCAVYISLIAETEEKVVVGHILFTPVELTPQHSGLRLLGLAPMAVLPEYQNQGIGSALVEAGLAHIKTLDYSAIAVLGHPHFYPKFGFVPSAQYDIKSEYDVPEDVFMLVELKPGVLKGHAGVIRFHEAFASV